MSTRYQILWKKGNDKLLTYGHSDGYPGDGKNERGVLKNFGSFLKWHTSEPNARDLDDEEYLIVNWFYWKKKQYSDEIARISKEKNSNGYEKLGYGVCLDGKLHRDIEYFYLVDLENRKISCWKNVRTPNNEVEEILKSEPLIVRKFPGL